MYPVQIIEAWRDIKISGHLQWYPGIKLYLGEEDTIYPVQVIGGHKKLMVVHSLGQARAKPGAFLIYSLSLSHLSQNYYICLKILTFVSHLLVHLQSSHLPLSFHLHSGMQVGERSRQGLFECLTRPTAGHCLTSVWIRKWRIPEYWLYQD